MRSLEKRAKEVIMEQMHDLAEISTETVMELIEPHYIFDHQKAKQQAIRRKAHSLMAQFRDERGIRSFFACHDKDGNSKYINIETTKDLVALNAVEKQINNKFMGLNESKKKIELQRMKLIEQLTLWESEN